jgi:hypothetical protein
MGAALAGGGRRVAEGTRRRGLGRDAPSGATTVRTGSWARNDHPLTTLAGKRESAAAEWTCRAPGLVVLHEWEWPGDRLFRLPTGSRDVTIDGRQHLLWKC